MFLYFWGQSMSVRNDLVQIPAGDMHCHDSTSFVVWCIEFTTSSYSVEIAIVFSRPQCREAGF